MFFAIVKSGTGSRAAELLGISQPAVSRALAELERSLGFSLFDRLRNRLVLTPEAKLFYRDVDASYRGLARVGGGSRRVAYSCGSSHRVAADRFRAEAHGVPY
jgi:DNA-binding transcriptional LysR family regulator